MAMLNNQMVTAAIPKLLHVGCSELGVDNDRIPELNGGNRKIIDIIGDFQQTKSMCVCDSIQNAQLRFFFL